MSAHPKRYPVAIPITDQDDQPETPQPETPSQPAPRRGFPPVVAPLALVLIAVTLSAATWLTNGTALGDGLRSLRFDEASWQPSMAYHTFVTHAFLHENAAELGYAALGIAVFGWVVQRNVGWWRTLLLFAFCAACSVGLWQAAKTDIGQEILGRMAGSVIDEVGERASWDAAYATAVGYDKAMGDLIGLQGKAWGAGGALAGLMMFALCRRRFDGRVAVKWWALLLAVVYVGVGYAVVWPTFAAREMPYVLLIGGTLGGLFFVVPDKFLAHLADALKDSALAKVTSGRRASATA